MKKTKYFFILPLLFLLFACNNSNSKTDTTIVTTTKEPIVTTTTQGSTTQRPVGTTTLSGISTEAKYVVNFNTNGGSFIQSQELSKGDKITKPENPTREGYTFDDWYYKGEKWSFIGHVVTEDMTLDAKWTANTNTKYKVEHYQQNIDNNNYTLYETDNLTGTTDTLTNASVKTYEGFTSPSITQVNINGDGSTIVKLYYTRNSYDVNLSKNIDKVGTVTGAGNYDYNKSITIIATTNPGYTFDGWYDAKDELLTKELTYSFNMPANNLSYTANWTANTNTKYKVEHYQQNIDNNYTLYETDNLTGTTDTLTNASVKTYEGFTSPSITQVNINGDGSTIVKLYYTRNSYDVNLSKNIDKAGTITGAGTYKYGKELTVTATTNEGYTFNGWYKDDELYTEEASFDITKGASTEVFEAKYTINKYTITLDNQAEGVTISGITSGNEYEYDSQITLSATNIPTGYTIRWTRSDGVITIGDNYSFKVPAYDLTITITKIPPYTRVDNKLYMGTYPQTRVTDADLITELNTKAGTVPTKTNSYNWVDYNYYISGSITSYMFYQDIDYDKDGSYDYRGVYFTQYRPFYFTYSSSTTNSYQDDNGYSTNTVYWFSYDPIEWNILREKDGKALIIANLILDSQEYYTTSSSSRVEHNGGTWYTNNYELSSIRKWLNDTFYNTAFNDLQKALIDTTLVDNSVESTNQEKKPYACDDTNDKMFLLSYKEAKTYYTSSTARQAHGTDYAKAQGLYVYTSGSYIGNSIWWLRSPHYYNADCAYDVDYDGGFYYNNFGYTRNGVRPACHIIL